MFTPTKLNTVLNIDKIVTVHYFEYAKDFIFCGEKHNFWEFVYIDKGKVGVMADKTGYTLTQGEIIFHKPNEYHNIWTNGVFANVAIVTFFCDDNAINFFKHKILRLDNEQKDLLALILKEGKDTFAEPLNLPLQTKMKRNKTAPFGSEQLIKTYLEQFLISLIRQNKAIAKKESITAKDQNEDRIVQAIVLFLKENINKTLSLDDVCKNICFSKSYLKQLFSRKKGDGIMEYFTTLKIYEARRLISEQKLNYTQISEALGYSSIHYFSRVFKKKTSMSPREYAKSVKKNALL